MINIYASFEKKYFCDLKVIKSRYISSQIIVFANHKRAILNINIYYIYYLYINIYNIKYVLALSAKKQLKEVQRYLRHVSIFSSYEITMCLLQGHFMKISPNLP